MADSIHVNDIGTQFEVQVLDAVTGLGVDLTPSGTVVDFLFRRPDETLFTVTPWFLNNGTDGWLVYTAASGDLNQPGIYRIQVEVTDASGNYHSDIDQFRVYPNI